MGDQTTEGEVELRHTRSPDEAPLALDPESFRRVGHALVDRIVNELRGLPQRPVTPGQGPETIREILGSDAPLPESGGDLEDIVAEATELLFENSLYNGHPRFFGYITASPAPIGILGDLLAAAVNPNLGAWTLSPMATEIEAQTVRWIAELIDYPTDCGGLLVSGGNMANMVGFFAARTSIGAEWSVREKGMNAPDAAKLVVYVSGEAHTWIQKTADLSGIGTDAIRWVGTDDQLRMDMDALRAGITADREAGYRPFMVVGTAGSVSTGAVDPLREMASLCHDEGLWFHVDGAYGGFAAAAPEAPADMAGIAEADSVAIDPHKWLYAPMEAGCALVRDAEALREAFAYHPPYYYFDVEGINYVDYGPQNSRGFRALKVWLGLKQAGRTGYARMISQDIQLSRRLHELVTAHPELEAMTQGLSISVFRFVPEELRDRVGDERTEAYLNELNQGVQDRLETGGEAFVSNSVMGGKYGLRACIVNINTTSDDVAALPEIVVRVGREVHADRS
jgi:aromatic-L-amino-acid/L-tryptophan decarboxylase